MIRKDIIKKIVILGAWFLVISGITTLLIAANRKKNTHVCNEIFVGIRSTGHRFFKKDDILNLIEKTAKGSLLMQPIARINLQQLERMLELNPWIKTAELYFDSKDDLHVFILEREPIARVFTTSGKSFLLDSSGHRMPMLKNVGIRLPVVTGFTNARKMNATDSTQLNEVKKLTWFLFHNQFWNAQIGQIDITPDHKFELVPVVGDHIIRIGSADNLEEKLNRLYIFYKHVMTKTGFNKYAALDVQFDKQVVAVHKGGFSSVDSIQLQKNIETMMNRASMQQVEAEMLPGQVMYKRDKE